MIESLFQSQGEFDEIRKKQTIEEKFNPNTKLLTSQNSLIERARSFNQQRL